MKTSFLRHFLLLIFLSLLGRYPAAASDQDVVAVLGSNLGPYQETLAGLQEVLGHPVPVLPLGSDGVKIPSGTRVIVAIGGKAVLQNYPKDIAFIYGVAPGILLPSRDRTAPIAKIYMTPSAAIVMHKLKQLQPTLQKLGILGLTASRDEFNVQMEKVGGSLGVEVIVKRLTSANEVPEYLRALRSRINALWIPPDPHLITRQNFELIKEFCFSNEIPLYVPTVELVEQGATAAVAVSFGDIGRTAGQLAKDMLAGTAGSGKVYPEKPRVAINMKSASEIRLKLSEEQLQAADKVVR